MPKPTSKPIPFPKNCSTRTCNKLLADIGKLRRRGLIKTYKSRKTGRVEYTEYRKKGGLGWDKTFIKKTIGGPSFRFKRCKVYAYQEKDRGKKVEETCTDYKPVNIPKLTMECYEKVAPFFKKIRGEKRGRPSQSYKILALLACNRPSRHVSMTPAIVSAVTEVPYPKVRKAMEKTDPLAKNGYIICEHKGRLPFIDEEPCRVPSKYSTELMAWVQKEIKRPRGEERMPMPLPPKKPR